MLLKPAFSKLFFLYVLLTATSAVFGQTPLSHIKGRSAAVAATGGQSSAVELQFIGNGQFLVISHEGIIVGF